MNRKYTHKKVIIDPKLKKVDQINAEMLGICADYMVGKPAAVIISNAEDILFMQSITRRLLQQAKAIH